MRLLFYGEEPFALFSKEEVFVDLFRVAEKSRKYIEKRNREISRKRNVSKKYKDFIEYNKSIVAKMYFAKYGKILKTKDHCDRYYARLLGDFMVDILLEPIKKVFFENKIAIYKTYRIEKRRHPIDEHFLESKEIASRILNNDIRKNMGGKSKGMEITAKSFATKNKIKLRSKKHLPFERIYMYDTRNENICFQLFFKKKSHIVYGKRKHDKVCQSLGGDGEAK